MRRWWIVRPRGLRGVSSLESTVEVGWDCCQFLVLNRNGVFIISCGPPLPNNQGSAAISSNAECAPCLLGIIGCGRGHAGCATALFLSRTRRLLHGRPRPVSSLNCAALQVQPSPPGTLQCFSSSICWGGCHWAVLIHQEERSDALGVFLCCSHTTPFCWPSEWKAHPVSLPEVGCHGLSSRSMCQCVCLHVCMHACVRVCGLYAIV